MQLCGNKQRRAARRHDRGRTYPLGEGDRRAMEPQEDEERFLERCGKEGKRKADPGNREHTEAVLYCF